MDTVTYLDQRLAETAAMYRKKARRQYGWAWVFVCVAVGALPQSFQAGGDTGEGWGAIAFICAGVAYMCYSTHKDHDKWADRIEREAKEWRQTEAN